MKQTTRIAIAALIQSAGQAFIALAAEFGGEAPAAEPQPEAPKKGKKAAATAPAAAEPTPEPAAEPAEEKVTGGKTYDELKAIIKPAVDDAKGLEVKQIIKKYIPGEGGLKELANHPQHHAAFEKDIAALAY